MNRRLGFWPFLLLLAVLSVTLRLMGLNWDQNLYLHPDERYVVWVTTDLRWPQSIGEFFDASTSPMNPYNTQHDTFVYGTFPSFLVKAIAGVVDMDRYGELHIVGRVTNAVFDTGTVLLTAILTRRFFNARAGSLAGLLLAFTPLFLQSAHFFTVDTISVFFAVAAFACVVRSWDRSSPGWMVLAGTMVGLAGASKPNYLIALAFIGLPVLELIRQRGWRALLPRLSEPIYPAIPAALAGGFTAFWTFRVAQPYAFNGPHWWNISLNQQWLDDLAFWRAVQTGLVDMKPSIQWIERTPVVYILQNMVLWGMGFALGMMALVALIAAITRLLRSPRWPSWWMLGIVGWCAGSIALYGTGIAQNQRYLMHIYPFLILLVAGFLIELEQRIDRRWIAQLLMTGVVVYTVVFGLAFNSLYTRPITRIEASEWIYENLPDGAIISNEYWDDALPMPLPGEDRSRFGGMTLDLYADESHNSDKVLTLVGQLSQVDYIVLSSNRVIDSVVRQPERYPVAVRYYEMLLNGELGFEPVATFRQGPEFLGIEWDDRSADESLIVYEHPEVRIFKKTDQYSAQRIHDELLDAWGYGGYHYIPGDPLPDQMLMSEAGVADLDEHGTWSEQVGSNWVQQHPLLAWWVGMQMVGLAAWPITWRAFRRLPDLGWMLAKATGLFGVSAITLLLVTWRGFSFDRGTILLSLLLLAAIGLATRRCVWDEFRYKLRRQWRSIVAGELLFLGIFLAAALVRTWQAIEPDHHLMHLTGVMRSVSLPPMDPWLSEGVLHTHWSGVLPWALLGRLLSLEPVVVYNLTIIGMLALIAGVVWSLVRSVSRSWLAVAVALVSAFGSSFAFAAGLAPMAVAHSVDLSLMTAILLVLVLLHSLVSAPQQNWTWFVVLAVIVGALAVSAGWGLLVAGALLAGGMAINVWMRYSSPEPWWPVIRRYSLELVCVIGLGIIIWFPAYSAFTATARNLVSPSLWSLTVLQDGLGLILLMAMMVVIGIGAISVISLLMDEGVPGVIVGGLAIGTMIALLVLVWRLDSALMMLMLVSLLAITAAWHWLHDDILLWSVALIVFASILLAMAQTRAFHPDLAGVSQARQLLPLAWMLIVVAIGLAAGRSVASMKSGKSIPWMFLSTAVVLVMIVPIISHLRASDVGERSVLARPTVLVSEADLQTAIWMQENLTGVPVVLTVNGMAPGQAGAINAMTGYPTVLGNTHTQRMMRPGWDRLIDQREIDVSTIYSGMQDWALVSPLLEQYGVRYIVLGEEERLRFGSGIEQSFSAAALNGHLRLVYQSDGVIIYEVISGIPSAEDSE